MDADSEVVDATASRLKSAAETILFLARIGSSFGFSSDRLRLMDGSSCLLMRCNSSILERVLSAQGRQLSNVQHCHIEASSFHSFLLRWLCAHRSRLKSPCPRPENSSSMTSLGPRGWQLHAHIAVFDLSLAQSKYG
jgi:hypothetical protein